MSLDDLAAAYLTAQRDLDQAISREAGTAKSIEIANFNLAAADMPPGADLDLRPGVAIRRVELAARNLQKARAAVPAAVAAHDKALADLPGKQAARDAAWAALVGS
jgi:hypothetical protein